VTAGTRDITVRAPIGYEFNSECGVVAHPSSRIFDDTAVDGQLQVFPADLPMDPDIPDPSNPYTMRRFDQRYKPWPAEVVVLRCLGRANIARIRIRQGLRQFFKYLFRLSVLRNPLITPDPNHFMLEYNGEASEPFEGISIWAFSKTVITPTTTAASLRSRPTVNDVTIQFMAVNDLPHGGHMRVAAPSGFIFPTECEVSISIHETEVPNYNLSAVPPGPDRANMLLWLEFMPEDVECHGDETPSSRARLHFTRNDKYLKRGVLYVLHLRVNNPQTVTEEASQWHLYSYQDLTVNHLIDSAPISGFPINSAMETFTYRVPESNNALAKHRLDFNISFPDTVEVGDIVTVVAPITYIFNEPGDSRCPQYVYLDGPMRRTQPTCGANIISWHLLEESVPALSPVRFIVQVQNPPSTPEINLFQVRHTASDGTRRSSRMIPGFEIIPKLENVSVAMVSPEGRCRPAVNVITGLVCEGAGSFGSIEVGFTPVRRAQLVQLQGHVAGESFGFLEAVIADGVPTHARSATAIAAQVELQAGVPTSLRIDGLQNPSAPGTAMWSITTFTTDPVPGAVTTTTVMPPRPCEASGPCGASSITYPRSDETLNLASFNVLGYIDVLSSSRVDPIYYNEQAATVTLDMRLEYSLGATDVLRITRPPGYRLLGGTLRTYRELQVGENGLDYMRRFSTDYENPEDFYLVITGPLSAGTAILFGLKADLPATPEQTRNWFFRTYRVLPARDPDGDIRDASQVPYPWVGRKLEATGTNDGAYSGFLLVGQIPFTVDPMLQTPGAEIRLSFSFGIAEGIEAENYVRLEIRGPAGFVVKDNCFAQGSPEFAKCTGYKNTATLVTVRNRLKGTDIVLHLAVQNPGATPTPNYWYLAVFEDDATQYVRWSQALSYPIVAMSVLYKGNNQLGESATSFFTFTPVRPSPTPLAYFVVTPPPSSNFRLFCTGVSPLGFVLMPQCTSGGVNEPLELRFDNASLQAEQAYTFGVRVYNAGGRPLPSRNYWGLTLKDHTRQTFDANLRIPGLDLKSIPLRCNGLGWTTAAPRVLATVLVQMRALHPLPAGTITVLAIRAPDGIMFNEDPGSIRVIPLPLPFDPAKPFTIAGDLLNLNLDQSQDIGQGLYNILFAVSNPSVYPQDNTWSIEAKKDLEVLFSHVITGYMEGQQSPFDLAASTLVASSAPRGWSGQTAVTRAAMVAFALSIARL